MRVHRLGGSSDLMFGALLEDSGKDASDFCKLLLELGVCTAVVRVSGADEVIFEVGDSLGWSTSSR